MKTTKKKTAPRKMRTFDEYLDEVLQDPEELQGYLDTALEAYQEDGNFSALLLALRRVAKIRGGMKKLSDNNGLTREHLYRAMSAKGNPRLDTFGLILKQMGLKLSIQVNHPA